MEMALALHIPLPWKRIQLACSPLFTELESLVEFPSNIQGTNFSSRFQSQTV